MRKFLENFNLNSAESKPQSSSYLFQSSTGSETCTSVCSLVVQVSTAKIEKKREKQMMWLKVLRQNITHLARRARGMFDNFNCVNTRIIEILKIEKKFIDKG